MTKPQVKIVNVETGEEIVRDATVDEISQMKIDAENAAARKVEAETKAAEKQALLDRLGISADEAKLLLG
jgi:hypothetical protein